MSPAEGIGLATLLVGLVGFGARLSVEADVPDVLAVVAICVSLGYIWGSRA